MTPRDLPRDVGLPRRPAVVGETCRRRDRVTALPVRRLIADKQARHVEQARLGKTSLRVTARRGRRANGKRTDSAPIDGRHYTLEVIQQPQRARACGFGDKVGCCGEAELILGPASIVTTAHHPAMGTHILWPARRPNVSGMW